ncbi:hypothetical protein EMIT043CA1_70166 [Pseudomonas brassicacearum]
MGHEVILDEETIPRLNYLPRIT